MNYLAVLVEFLGTFIFLSVIVAFNNPWITGGTLAMLIYLSQEVSGGHFNPVVTLMNLYNRGIGSDNASAYIVAQATGGLLAAAVYTTLKNRGVL
jgi:glycerol uptake facilitator-like aquaporin